MLFIFACSVTVAIRGISLCLTPCRCCISMRSSYSPLSSSANVSCHSRGLFCRPSVPFFLCANLCITIYGRSAGGVHQRRPAVAAAHITRRHSPVWPLVIQVKAQGSFCYVTALCLCCYDARNRATQQLHSATHTNAGGMLCMPAAAHVHLGVQGLEQSSTLRNLLTVDSLLASLAVSRHHVAKQDISQTSAKISS